MPVRECTALGRPGFKYGDRGKCYTYNPRDPKSKARARLKAEMQGRAIRQSQQEAGKPQE